MLNAKKDREETVQAALDAVDAVHGPTLGHPVRAAARPSPRGRRDTVVHELEAHFKKTFDVGHVTTACEYLADQGRIGKASIAARLTRRSNVDVQELAFFALDRLKADTSSPRRGTNR
jgi:hypothetical protein